MSGWATPATMAAKTPQQLRKLEEQSLRNREYPRVDKHRTSPIGWSAERATGSSPPSSHRHACVEVTSVSALNPGPRSFLPSSGSG